VSGIPFADDQGPFLFVILLDITSRKQAEAALQESQRQQRDLSKHLELVREEERAHIARELHDELGSFLNMLKLDLSRLGKQLPAGLLACREKTQAMEGQVNEGIQTVEKIITDLRPSILDHLGLFPAIEWLVENFRKRTGIHCLLTLPDIDITIENTLRTAIFRIVQETLTNIIAHAKASDVMITTELNGNDLLLTINDNGVGMTPLQQQNPSGYGIQGMRERALYFGGELNVTSSPETGTTVVLHIPIQHELRERMDD
jgi:signal transduction histidine kinase